MSNWDRWKLLFIAAAFLITIFPLIYYAQATCPEDPPTISSLSATLSADQASLAISFDGFMACTPSNPPTCGRCLRSDTTNTFAGYEIRNSAGSIVYTGTFDQCYDGTSPCISPGGSYNYAETANIASLLTGTYTVVATVTSVDSGATATASTSFTKTISPLPACPSNTDAQDKIITGCIIDSTSCPSSSCQEKLTAYSCQSGEYCAQCNAGYQYAGSGVGCVPIEPVCTVADTVGKYVCYRPLVGDPDSCRMSAFPNSACCAGCLQNPPYNYDCTFLITSVSGGSGVLICGESKQCGVADQVCPSDYSAVGVSCSVCDSDCSYGGTLGSTACNNQPADGSGICLSNCQLKAPVMSVSVSAACTPPLWSTTSATATAQCDNNGGLACADGSGGTTNTLALYVSTTPITSCPNTYLAPYTLGGSALVTTQSWICSAGQNTAGVTDFSDVPVSCNIDTQAPTVTISSSPPTPLTAWTKDDATATVVCSDNTGGSGCNSATYKYLVSETLLSVCPADENQYTLGPNVVVSNHNWVCGFARDNANNIGVSAPTEFMIDKYVDSVSANHDPPQPTTSTPVTITATATDSMSGLAGITISINSKFRDSCTSSPCTTSLGLLAPGTYRYSASATDKVGNVRSLLFQKSFTVLAAPAVSVTHSPASPKTSDTVTITATASPASGTTISSMRIFVDGALKQTCTSVTTCTYSQVYPYKSTAYSYYADATDNLGQIGTSATQTFRVNDAPTTPPVTFTGSCTTGGTITIQCLAADINQPDNTLGVRGWAGQCDGANCINTRSWASGTGITYFADSPMTVPDAADGQPFTKTLTINQPAGTAIAATCRATDENGSQSSWGDSYPLCTVGCPESPPAFANIQTTADYPPDYSTTGPVTITFTASRALVANPVVEIIPGQEMALTTQYNASFVSKNNNDYTYSFNVLQGYANGRADIEVTGDSGTCAGTGTAIGQMRIDTLPPTTTPTCGGQTCDQPFFGDTLVQLACADNIAGCKEVHYSIDGGSQQVVAGSSASFTLGLGMHTVNYFSVDNLNNAETSRSQSVNIFTIDDVEARLSVSVAPATVNYGQWVKAYASGGLYLKSTGQQLQVFAPENALVTDMTITTVDGLRNFIADSGKIVRQFTSDNYDRPNKRWQFYIDTTTYRSTVFVCVQHIAGISCGTGSYTVNGVPSISISIVFPDKENLVIPVTPAGYANFAKPMPIKFTASGTVSTTNAECTSSNCRAWYSIDDQPQVEVPYDGFERAFTSAPLSQAFACDTTHLLTVIMNTIDNSISSRSNATFFLSCQPRLTVSPAERRVVLGDRNLQAFTVTIWNPLNGTTFDLEMKTKKPVDSFMLNSLNFQGDGYLFYNQYVPSLSSQSFIVMLNNNAAGRSGSFGLQFTATDKDNIIGKTYSTEAALLVFAESLPEFAAWQLVVMGVIAGFIFYVYGAKDIAKARAAKEKINWLDF